MNQSKKCENCNGTGVEIEDQYGLGIKNPSAGKECFYCRGCGWDTYETDDLVCPHCGYSDDDSFELDDDCDSAKCDLCGKEFEVEIEVTRTFTTRKIK